VSSLIPTAANGNLRTSGQIRRHGQTRRRRRRGRRRLLPLQAQLLLEFTHHSSQSSFSTRLSRFLGTTTTGELFFHFRRGLIYFILDHLRGFLHRRRGNDDSGVLLGLLFLELLLLSIRHGDAREESGDVYFYI